MDIYENCNRWHRSENFKNTANFFFDFDQEEARKSLHLQTEVAQASIRALSQRLPLYGTRELSNRSGTSYSATDRLVFMCLKFICV